LTVNLINILVESFRAVSFPARSQDKDQEHQEDHEERGKADIDLF